MDFNHFPCLSIAHEVSSQLSSKSKPRFQRTVNEDYAFRSLLDYSASQNPKHDTILAQLQLDPHQEYVRQRPAVVTWLAEACEVFGIRAITLHLAIRVMDIVALNASWNHLLPLCALTCLYTASKYEDSKECSHVLKDWEFLGIPYCSAENIRNTELIILALMRWDFSAKTPMHFFAEYLAVLVRHLALEKEDANDKGDRDESSTLMDYEPSLQYITNLTEEVGGDVSDISSDEAYECSDYFSHAYQHENPVPCSTDCKTPESLKYFERAWNYRDEGNTNPNSCSPEPHYVQFLNIYRIAARILDFSLLHPKVYYAFVPEVLAASALHVGCEVYSGQWSFSVDIKDLCAHKGSEVELCTAALKAVLREHCG
ncbi:G2/mitotic-specific cyclin-1 [Gracilariopsis chorda]|uniref:G2/mitotic-specific cyclin-1 n=1 Tax=Gracilariopsis chorda TaxID=448386 RepID=A0A2V3IYP7_9FLOR|nr:G2/mitotic-specific cyclin-1 [Gracilariopsis chorda]|eukprot:PXF46807.1 G2/mitotic-specific cyclin-1 [Gracilariopsis chorda]